MIDPVGKAMIHRYTASILRIGVMLCAVQVSPALIGAARAQEALGADEGVKPSGDKSVAEYLMDLDGDDAGDRLMAARVLRGQLRRALRTLERGRPGTLAHDDARALMVELDQRLPEACMNALAYPDVAYLAAEMLAMLEIRSAIPAIELALQREEKKRRQERINESLLILRALPEGP